MLCNKHHTAPDHNWLLKTLFLKEVLTLCHDSFPFFLLQDVTGVHENLRKHWVKVVKPIKREEITHFCVPTPTPVISLKYPRGLKQQYYCKVKALPNTQLKFQEKNSNNCGFYSGWNIGVIFLRFSCAHPVSCRKCSSLARNELDLTIGSLALMMVEKDWSIRVLAELNSFEAQDTLR